MDSPAIQRAGLRPSRLATGGANVGTGRDRRQERQDGQRHEQSKTQCPRCRLCCA